MFFAVCLSTCVFKRELRDMRWQWRALTANRREAGNINLRYGCWAVMREALKVAEQCGSRQVWTGTIRHGRKKLSSLQRLLLDENQSRNNIMTAASPKTILTVC